MRVIFAVSILSILLLPVAGQQHVHSLNPPYKQLKVSGNIHLRLVPSDSTFLEFETEEFPESLTIEQDKNQLLLRSKTEISQSPAIVIKLHHTSLDRLEITMGAVVQSADTLHYDVLSLKVETGGKAEITIAADSLNARVSQGSDIILYGSARSIQVNANTAGNFLAYELQTENAWVKASTASQVKVYARRLLNANASGKSFIAYRGEPAVKEFTSSLGGEISSRTE